RPKRQPKPSSDEGYWDCSVCTFRNSAEAFKCMMCDVRKGTSTRKPRPVSQLVAQQVTQQFASPTQPKKEKKDKAEKEKNEKETTVKKNSHKKTRPRLKNVDRSSAQHLEVTVGDLTVIITDFKEKTKSTPTSSATSADQHSQSGSSSDNTERGMSRYIMRKPDASDASDPSNTPVETMHLAVVACGERLEETVTMLKSVVLFNIKPIQFHIFAEDNLHIKFKDILDSWSESYRLKFSYTVYSITFPSENAAEWKKLFKPCASQRLFLPIILKDVDSLLYVDTDILFLQPVDEMWSFFREFNSTQIAAMAPEHEEPSIGWYNRFARHPFYGKTGINSGVMLMNMTRIRKKYFKKAFLYSPAIGIIALITVFMAVTANLLKKEVSSFFMETGEFIMIISSLLLKRSTKQYNNVRLENDGCARQAIEQRAVALGQ
ncbi:UNVERIFIED_CONTAM: hypothetical protein FKN15_065002, partial [Acipenser sinensis]